MPARPSRGRARRRCRAYPNADRSPRNVTTLAVSSAPVPASHRAAATAAVVRPVPGGPAKRAIAAGALVANGLSGSASAGTISRSRTASNAALPPVRRRERCLGRRAQRRAVVVREFATRPPRRPVHPHLRQWPPRADKNPKAPESMGTRAAALIQPNS